MRHHGRAEDADGEQHAVGAGEVRDQPAGDAARVDVRPAAGRRGSRADDAEQAGDRQLEAPVAARLQREDAERDDGGDQAGGERRHAEQQVERDRRADELRQVGGDRDHLRLHPQAPGHRAREVLAAQLGQAAARDDARSWPTGTGRASPSGSRRRSPTPAGSRTWRRRRCSSRSCPDRCTRPRPRTPGRTDEHAAQPAARAQAAQWRLDGARQRERGLGGGGRRGRHAVPPTRTRIAPASLPPSTCTSPRKRTNSGPPNGCLSSTRRVSPGAIPRSDR